jgi:hypothetical protein
VALDLLGEHGGHARPVAELDARDGVDSAGHPVDIFVDAVPGARQVHGVGNVDLLGLAHDERAGRVAEDMRLLLH